MPDIFKTKVYDAFQKAPLVNKMVSILSNRVPASYSALHRARCEIESIAALEKVLGISKIKTKGKKSG